MLLGVEVEIAATSGVQRLMRAALDDAPGFDDQDLLRAPNGRKPVRDHECSSAAHQVAQALLNQRFGFGIKAGGSLIENEDAGIGKDRARNGNALLLSTRELHSAFTNHGVVLFLEGFREFVDARDPAS